tara:strand:- start:926 stop:1513 length:588 start_codon:yes stop_codon:yes gene_type:complete
LSLIYSLIWAAISITSGVWLGDNGFKILSYIFYAFAFLCFVYPLNNLNYKRNKNNQDNFSLSNKPYEKIIQITCQNCGINEVHLDLNIRENSKMYSTDVLYTRKDGTHVRPILCFNCDYISEFIGGIGPLEIEYLECYKLNIAMKDKFLDYAKSFAHQHAINKIKNIKISKPNGFFPSILFIMIGIGLIIFFGSN